jgi:hypothetical protein
LKLNNFELEFKFLRDSSQVVPNARSRSQMGEVTDGGLFEIFQQEYGLVGSPRFEEAREKFVVSSAGYAVASLLLQPKDRHNGNLLFDKYGFCLHFLNFAVCLFLSMSLIVFQSCRFPELRMFLSNASVWYEQRGKIGAHRLRFHTGNIPRRKHAV